MRTARYLVYLLIIAAGFTACSKSVTGKANGNHTVRIRVDNKTSLTAASMKVNGEDYGTVTAGESSSYHSFSNLTGIPSVTFYNDTTQVILALWFCGTGMPEPTFLENGDYVYTITTNVSSNYGCDYSFIKEK